MICWYCYWGWPKIVADIYTKALKALEAIGSTYFTLTCGPAHIVWDDENFGSTKWCLEHFDEYSDGCSEAELAIVKQSLEELAKLPEEAWDIIPDDYDGQHPELYPPPEGIEMVRV